MGEKKKGGFADFIKEQKANGRLWLFALFVAYIFLLVWVVIFKTRFLISDLPNKRALNLIPFHYTNVQEGDWPFVEAFLNVLVFVPLGVYLRMFKVRPWFIAACGFLTSLAFELLQYILSIGTTDITDLITNTLGTLVGVGIYMLLWKIVKRKDSMDKIVKSTAAVLTLFALAIVALFLIDEIMWKIK